LPVLNRARASFKHTAGLFTGVSSVWLQVPHTSNFVELVQQINRNLQSHYRHQRFPVSELNRAVGMEPSLHQLFDVSLSYENHDHNMQFGSVPGQAISYLPGYQAIPLTLFVRDFHARHPVRFDFVYNQAYFNAEDIQALQARFIYLLQQLQDQSQLPIQQLSILTQAEINQLQTWNDTTTNYPKDQTLVDLFETQVAQTPDNIAVSFEGNTLTYQQLNARANQLAHYLRSQTDATGEHPLVQPDTLVGICVERSLEMIVGLLGILKAGGAYVPLDPDYPAERLAYMLQDSQVPILLTQQQLQAQLPDYIGQIVCLDDPALIADQPEHNLPRIAQPHHLAYVIYTSGSTGKPKGVMIAHQSLSHFLRDMQQRTALQPQEQAIALTTLSFDIAGLELYLPLISGATIQLLSRTVASDGEALQSILSEQNIRLIQATPATWQLLQTSGWQAKQHLTLLCGGEKLSPELGHYLLQQSEQLWNVYGPTETTIWSATHDVTGQPAHPEQIGQPIANTLIHILDRQHQVVPIGIPGELCIAGAGLARGYLNRPELTAEKFIEVDLFGNTERVYKTGDLARWLPDGNLEYLGRIDHQVKLRGFRIELGEIEAVLSQQASVSEAVVVVHERDGNQSLAAYLTTTVDETPDTATLRDALQARLPDYMVPNSFTVLDQMPLTPNGKIDRKALPEPLQVVLEGGLRSDAEQILADLWSDVLRCDVTSHQAHFFELGGHSLLATQLTTRIRATFDIDMPLATLFAQPVLADQAHWLSQQQRGGTLPAIQAQPAEAPKVPSFAQQRLWFLAQLEGASATYNMPAALRLQGELHLPALRDTFVQIVTRHDSLRHCFVAREDEDAAQVCLLAPYDPLTITDLQHLDGAAQNAAVAQHSQAHAQQPFDLSIGPLLSLELLQLAEKDAVLLLNMHHIISDGWSSNLLIREWITLYTALSQGDTPQLAPLSVQYTDYTAWQREVLAGEVLTAQQTYWQTQLADAPQLLELPADYPRPAQQSYCGAHYQHALSAELTAQINQLSRTHNATQYMTLLAAFNVLLYRYTGQHDILVGSPIA
ncbi:MAG: amino acid adenylation domain-containing protein, partial [Pseudomonadota bacterium]